MNKKIILIALSIALTGLLTYFLLPGTLPGKPPAVSDKAASTVSGSLPPAVDQQVLKEHTSPREQIDAISDDAVSSAADSPEQQPVPALEPEIREALGNMLNTSSEGLVEETRNGVTSVDLQGRFHTVPVATIDKDGNVQITDYSHLPRASTQP